MSHSEFLASLDASAPPANISQAQTALWHAHRGDWDAAHEHAQADSGPMGAWVHAYLHRWEGDAGNAAYWYRRAGQPVCELPLEAEWQQLADALFPQ